MGSSSDFYDHTFHLTGADGSEHKYEVMLHRAMPGAQIMFSLLSLLSEPLVAAVGSALPALQESGGKVDLRALVAKLDAEALGKIGVGLQRALSSEQAAPLVRAILNETHRDGHHLRGDNAFNAAYRGNYLEMMEAVQRVVTVNGFFPVPGGLSRQPSK